VFGLDRPWRLDERVAVRPEPFGALLYHFGTRRLSFLKNATLLAVRSLAGYRSARSACAAAGIGDGQLPAYARALAALADSKMITERAGAARPGARVPRRRPGRIRAVSAVITRWP
jgi:putative mycofactocin binding protein MftB